MLRDTSKFMCSVKRSVSLSSNDPQYAAQEEIASSISYILPVVCCGRQRNPPGVTLVAVHFEFLFEIQ